MASPSRSRGSGGNGQQLLALIRKNFLLAVVRKPLGFLLLFYGLPLAILAVLLSIPSFMSSYTSLGVASPQPIMELASALDKQLVIIQPPNLGPDVGRVIDSLTKSLDKNKIVIVDNEKRLLDLCLANSLGVSNCFAALTFVDSPQTTQAVIKSSTGNNHTWQYTIRVDPAKSDTNFNIFSHNTDSENTIMPLQLAVNNAITNRNDRPSSIPFTTVDKKEAQEFQKKINLTLMGDVYVFALLSCFYMIIYRYTTFVTTERDIGMSQLVDSMGGRWAPAMRVLAWIITIDIITLPCYIGFGILHWRIAFPTSDVGLLIGWQILQGLAVNSSIAFASAFFTKARVSSIYVVGAFLLFSVATQAYSFSWNPPPGPAGAHILALLFPSGNYVFFTQQMILWEYNSQVANIRIQPEKIDHFGINSTSYKMTQSTMLGFLALQIIYFPLLAMLVEYKMHGINFRSRKFDAKATTQSNDIVVQSTGLKKIFKTGVFKKRTVNAVDGVSIEGHKGQILCLAGPNGSGKTTTLHIIAGFIKPTDGEVSVAAEPSQIGICPQRNTLWGNLTVKEHVRIWSKIKGGKESEQDLVDLIRSCDLSHKENSQARTLSGGQKRKLQLACMFVGNSTVCLIDECTSGLDPLSRRIIWEILLKQRAKRSILFTTHFLDEVDVLADHIVILSKGKVKCQGPVAELKSRYGNGYKVIVPNSTKPLDNVQQYPAEVHQDSRMYTVPDSLAAAKLSSSFAAAGATGVSISGPQVEDVFLNVAEDVELDADGNATIQTESPGFKMSPSRLTSFWTQVGALYRKRWVVLKKFWWPYFYVVALPIIIIPNLQDLLKLYRPDPCRVLRPKLGNAAVLHYPAFVVNQACRSGSNGYGRRYCPQIYVGSKAADDSLRSIVKDQFYQFGNANVSLYNSFINVSSTEESWNNNLRTAYTMDRGGVYFKSADDSGLVAFKPNLFGYVAQFLDLGNTGRGSRDGDDDDDDDAYNAANPGINLYGSATGAEMLSIYSQMKSQTQIITSIGGFAQKAKPILNTGIIYTVFFSLVQAIYPAAFVLYPAIEKNRMVRSVQYANGVRRAPLWFAYGLFDFLFVIIISVAITIVMYVQVHWVGTTLIMLPILILYGLAAMLQTYIIAHFVTGPLKSFLTAFGTNVLLFAIAAVAFGVGNANAASPEMDPLTLGIAFGLFLILPIGNVFRGLVLGFNVAHTRCRGASQLPLMSIYAYGGPILYLVLQIIFLLGILVWIEGDIALFRKKSRVVSEDDSEKRVGSSGSTADVDAERMRVEGSNSDLLRILHLSKRFGSNQAVDDITMGISQSEVLALIGPNGAGKSTLVNLIQSDLSADHGTAYLCGEDSRTRTAQTHLGVCPQYDAMDMLNPGEILMFYARIKGVKEPRANVNHVMAKLGLTAHAKTSATKLSGGNKRKLSLAIALIGTPPVLVLDEPTSAMDAVAKRSFWKIIKSIASEHSVLLTTHSMEEADTLATRAAIISKRLLAVGTSQALRQRYSNLYHVSLILRSAPSSTAEEMQTIQRFIADKIPGAELERDMLGGQVRFTIPGYTTEATNRGGPEGQDTPTELNVVKVINLLEDNKERLGLECYSVAAATLENVFLSVVRANNVLEEDSADQREQGWAKRLGAMF